jgi:hypothetical protein
MAGKKTNAVMEATRNCYLLSADFRAREVLRDFRQLKHKSDSPFGTTILRTKMILANIVPYKKQRSIKFLIKFESS